MSTVQPESRSQGDVNPDEIASCTCPNSSAMCPAAATVANLRVVDVPLRNMSCFMAAHNPLNGVENTPSLTWDDNRFKFIPVNPADWAHELMAKNPTRRQHDRVVQTMLLGMKAVTDLLDADPPPKPPMSPRDHQLETRHAYILGWLEEFRQYVVAAHENGQIFTDKINKLVESIQVHHEAMVQERGVLMKIEAALNAGETISMKELEDCMRSFDEHSAALEKESEELHKI
ncbi:hypothetical protein AURDEDRAFT_166833 [Auricularia subglabra TFB-10046 SS5]|nr:hypothetical protein AURDEDRAFT_166833 [Auricularia subglabra TFB-10046 SS5]